MLTNADEFVWCCSISSAPIFYCISHIPFLLASLIRGSSEVNHSSTHQRKRNERANNRVRKLQLRERESVRSQTPGQDLQVKPCSESMRKRGEEVSGGEGARAGWVGGTVRTYYGNRYSFVFPSPDWNRRHGEGKKQQTQVETNVYADQITGNRVKKKWNKEK